MENSYLYSLIEKAQLHDMASFAVIFSDFEKLIYFYSRRLGGEDQFQELSLFLLELIYSIELSRFPKNNGRDIEKYIVASIRNKYIFISKRQERLKKENLPILSDSTMEDSDWVSLDALKEALNRLPNKQRETVLLKYIYGYSDVEIANHFCVTRQSVNRIKNRALQNLRDYYMEEF